MSTNHPKLRIGISSCLLGLGVRYNGGHKRDRYITDILDNYFEWEPVCPEVEVGMGTPREAVRLVMDGKRLKMTTSTSGKDWTKAMKQYVRSRVRDLKKANLHGYILKARSPSCGMQRVKRYTPQGMPSNSGPGVFAEELIKQIPHLPVEEEGRLNDPRLRENFIVRVFCYYRWQRFRSERFSMKNMLAFHTQHKFLVMAHNEAAMRMLGKLVANGKAQKPSELLPAYEAGFFNALKKPATTNRHVNVLQHIAGFLSDQLESDERKELDAAIRDYHKELLPLVVPITLIRHHQIKHKNPYLMHQVYLNPHPKELMLLNHV